MDDFEIDSYLFRKNEGIFSINGYSDYQSGEVRF